MRDENIIFTPFHWSHVYFLQVAEVLFALLDAEEDSQRRPAPPCGLRETGQALLTLEELGAYHRQLFLWGWRFSLPRQTLSQGPEGTL